MLYNGEHLGSGQPPQVDIAVDPIDGTRPLALGLNNSIATVALAPRGSMFNPGPFMYMNKIAVGPDARDVIDIEAPPTENLRRIARAKGANVNDLTVVILDRANRVVYASPGLGLKPLDLFDGPPELPDGPGPSDSVSAGVRDALRVRRQRVPDRMR